MAAEEAAKPSTLPPYPELILEAIDALNDKNGSNKSAISKHIEDKYADLPPAHASLLAAHLARMKETGELIFTKNNYFRAGATDAPPKRGRGRPPKPRDPNAPPPAPKPSSGRGRGRPRKDPNAPPKAKPASGRGRGRPPKAKEPVDAKATTGSPRPRGRPPKDPNAPPKAKKAKTDAPATPAGDGSSTVKRGRGRPPKVRPSEAAAV